MNETEIEDGDNMLTLFYRDKPLVENEITFDDLKFQQFNHQRSWKDLIKDADYQSGGKELVHIIQTPKNIGQANVQLMWYTNKKRNDVTFKVLRRDNGNWHELIDDVKDWLNQYIPPHMLVSVSLFEDAHENVGKGINACIAHKAGSNLQNLSDNLDSNDGALYDIQVIDDAGSHGEWEDLFDEAKAKINATGG